MNKQHPEDLLPGYALGCLDDDELRLVKAHLPFCPHCSELVRTFGETCSCLAHLAPVEEPPEALKGRLLALARTKAGIEKRTSFRFLQPEYWRDILLPAGALACLLLIIALGFSLWPLRQQAPAPQIVQVEQLRLIRLVGTDRSPQAQGTLVINAGQTEALLQVDGLASLPPESQYQLWLIRDGARSNGGVFSVDRQGTARLLVKSERPLESFDAFGITIEPYGGSPGPTGPKVLGGKAAG